MILTEITATKLEPMQEFHLQRIGKEQRKMRKVGHSKKTTVVKEDLENKMPDYTGHKEVG